MKNTTGRERWDLQIQQVYNTQRVVPTKKTYSRKKYKKIKFIEEQ